MFIKCSKCNKKKESINYYKDSSMKNGFFSWCKNCCENQRKERKEKNKLLLNKNKTGKKVCSICKTEKSFENYSKNLNCNSGLLSSCKECENKKQHKIRKQNSIKNKILNLDGEKKCALCKKLKSKKMFHINRLQHDGFSSYCKQCFKTKRVSYQKMDLRRFLLSSAKYRAKKKNITFSLKKEDIIIPKKCPIFGTILKYSEGGKTDNSPTIDRIDNTKGYEKENIEIISFKANRIKSNASIEELIKLANFYKKKDFKNDI